MGLSTAAKCWIAGGCTICGLVIIYTCFGFFGVPALIKWGANKYGAPILDRQITTQDIYFNPYTLYLNIKGLNIQKDGTKEPLIYVADLNTKISWESLFRFAPILDHLSIDGFQANIVRTGLSQFNFSDIIENIEKMSAESAEENKGKEEKPSEPMKFTVLETSITNSGVTLVDDYRHQTDKITNFDFKMPMVSNFQEEVEVPITPTLTFDYNGHPFNMDANSLPFTISQKTGLNLQFKDLNLPGLASFNPIELNAIVKGGTLSAKLNLNFANDDKQTSQVKELRLTGTVEMKDVVVENILPEKPYDVLSLGSINVDLKKLALFAQEIELGEVKISSPNILVIRNDEGINLAELATHIIRNNPLASDSEDKDKDKEKEEKDEKALEDAQKAEAKEWQWSLAQLQVNDGTVRFQDATNGFTEDVTPLQLTIGPVSSAQDSVGKLAFSTALIGGNIAIDGDISVNPVKADLNVKTQDLGVGQSKPYLDPYVKGAVTGTLSNEGKATFALEDDAPSYSYKGNLSLNGFNVVDEKGAAVATLNGVNLHDVDVSGKNADVSVKGKVDLTEFTLTDPRQTTLTEPVKFKGLSVDINHIDTGNQKAAIGEVKLVEPDTSLILNKDGINLADLGTYLAKSMIKDASAEEVHKDGAAEKADASEAKAEEKAKAEESKDEAKEDATKAEGKTEVVETKKDEELQKDAEAKIASAEKEPNPADEKSWAWSLDKAVIENGVVHFVDETNNFSQDVTPINVAVGPLSSEEKQTGEVEFSTGVIGGTINVNGVVGINPVLGNLKVQTQNLDISAGKPYIEEFLNGTLAGLVSNTGTVTFAVDNGEAGYNYDGNVKVDGFNLTNNKGAGIASFTNLSVNNIALAGKNATVAVKAGVQLNDFALSDPRGEPGNHQVRIKQVDVALNEVDTEKQSASVGDVKVIEPAANVIMSDKGINLAELGQYLATSLVKQDTAKPAGAKEAKEEKKASAPWKWNVARVQVSGGHVQFTDAINKFTKNIAPISASAGPISQNFGNAMQVGLDAGVLGGTVAANGSVVIEPLKVDVTTKTNGLQISELTPFISPYLNAHITSGQVSNNGKVIFSMPGDKPDVQYDGSFGLSKLNVTDAQGAPVASVGNLAATGINLKFANNISVGIQDIAIANPTVDVTKSASGVTNVETLVKSSGDSKETKSDDQTATGLPAITLNQISLSNGVVRYSDNQMKPPFTVGMTNLKGSVNGFTTVRNAPAKVNISGLLNGTPMQANGTVNPFANKLMLNMNGQVTALSLPAFSQFSSEFVGYPITQGQLNYKGNIKIDNSKLTSTNNITINRLEFGNEDPNAKDHLPVKLAVSLLQNRNGQIDLNLPVNGALDDPNFSVAGVIVKVLTNLISKAVTAPFSLIGSLFGGASEHDLNNLVFLPASTQLTPSATRALDVVAKAMADHPNITLQVTGAANPQIDGPNYQQLATQRAEVVRDYLIQRQRVNPSRIFINTGDGTPPADDPSAGALLSVQS